MTSTWHVNREYEGIEISFDGKPSEEIRNKMKSVGFKWSSAQMKWYAKDNDRTRKVANELATQGEDVGEHLTFEQKMERDKERAERRQERLGEKAGKLERKSEALLDQAHKMASVIPFGQPILVGHHSEGRDRRFRGRIHDKFGKGFETMDEAKEVSQRLEGSQALSQKRESPGYMSRKIDQLEADLRKFERDKGQWQGHLAEWEKRTNDLKEQITYWKKQLEEAGGLKVTPDDVKVGDEILYLGTWYEVVRVNPKTVTIKNWLDIPKWTWGAEYSKIREVRHKSYENPLELKPKIPDAEFEKAKLFLSSLSMARTLDELTGWQPAVKRWSIKFPELEKELESEYQARFDYLKAAKETAESQRKEKASKPQSEQAKDLYKQMRKINSVRELDDWRNQVLFEAHLPDVEEDILLRDLAAKWRVYLEIRGIPALEKLTKLPLDYKNEDYYFGTEVTVQPTTQIFDDVPWRGILHEARNGGELWEVARVGHEQEGTSRVPIERLYVTKLVQKPEPRYQPSAPDKHLAFVLSPEYLSWLKVELHRSDDPIIAESKKNKGFRLFVKSIDEAKKEFVVEKDVYVNHANGIVSEMPGTEYNRGKRYPLENFDIMPFSEYLKKEGIKFQYKESLNLKYVIAHWNGGEGWSLGYKPDKKEYSTVNSKNFLTLDEINALLSSSEAKLYVYETRGEEFFRWKPFTVPYPEFKWHSNFIETGKNDGRFYELLHATYESMRNIWMWSVSVTDAEQYHKTEEISEPQLKSSFTPIEKWKVREADLLTFLKKYDTPTWDTSLHFIEDSIRSFKESINKFPIAERDKYELILDTLKSRVRAKIEADIEPVKPNTIERITVDLHTKGDETYVEILGWTKEGKSKILIKESNHGDWGKDMIKFGKKGYYDKWSPVFVGKTFEEVEKPIEQPAEKPKFVVENPFGVDLSKSIVPYTQVQDYIPKIGDLVKVKKPWGDMSINETYEVAEVNELGDASLITRVSPKELIKYGTTRATNLNFIKSKTEPLIPNLNSPDYKAGYNLAIRGRIAPAVPAWSDQGQADYDAGYKAGQLKRAELKPKEVSEPPGYFSLKKAQDLTRENNLKLSDEQLQKKSVVLKDYIRFIESPDEYSRNTLIKGGYFAGVEHPEATGLSPVDIWLHNSLKTALEEVYKEQDRRKKEKETVPVFGQKPQQSPLEFGSPNNPVLSKPVVLGAPSRQEQTEKEARRRAEEGKRLKGQQVLTSAISTSKRLSAFEEKPIIPQPLIKSMVEAQAEMDKEEERKAKELANQTIAEITIQKLKKQISFEQQRLF